MEEHDKISMEVKELYMKYTKSRKGKFMRDVLKELNIIAKFLPYALSYRVHQHKSVLVILSYPILADFVPEYCLSNRSRTGS